jgi:hypothetical protein
MQFSFPIQSSGNDLKRKKMTVFSPVLELVLLFVAERF